MVRTGLSSDYYELETMIQENKLQQAEELAKSLLAADSKDSNALHLYAIIAYKSGRLDIALNFAENCIAITTNNKHFWNTAGFLNRLCKNYDKSISYLTKAIEIDDHYSDAFNNLGISYSESGNQEKALTIYHKALLIDPNQSEVLNNLGNLYAQKEDFGEAIKNFDKAISLNGNYAQAWSNKAETTLRHKGLSEDQRQKDYIECLTNASELAPGWLEVQWKYANVLSGQKDLSKAEEVLRRSLNTQAYQKEHVPLMVNLAKILDQQFALDEAILWARQAVIFMPENIPALQVFAHISLRIGNPIEALNTYQHAVSVNADLADLHYGMGNCYMRLEQLQKALDCYLIVHNMDKENARGIFAPAACLLLNGEYEKGWKAYESRYRVDGFKPNVPNIMHRLWDGSPLNGRHLVVHVEQGYGDTFQFCRYLKELRNREGTDHPITFLCEPETYRLMKTLAGPSDVLSLGNKMEIKYDVQIPLLSLPHHMGTTLETVPNDEPYLSVPNDVKIDIPALPKSTLKVGIVWAGRPTHADDRYRSIDIKQFSELFGLEKITFYALQWGERSKDIEPWLESHSNVIDNRVGLADFADTAGFIDQLDLVIAVDTSVAHLAGAMGKPVWTLIPYGAEWRWMLGHETTPWYPTMRLYRQKVLGHWAPVFDRLKQHLQDVIEERKKETAAH